MQTLRNLIVAKNQGAGEAEQRSVKMINQTDRQGLQISDVHVFFGFSYNQ
jgi:hypothetical protein